jgi:hypothetical protein
MVWPIIRARMLLGGGAQVNEQGIVVQDPVGLLANDWHSQKWQYRQ